MPDRYGESDDDPVVDFDSRRQARDTAAAVEAARMQRERIAEGRAVHAPLTADQSATARRHRNDVTDRAERARNALRIANCRLCNADGYRGSIICDHIDRSRTAATGMQRVREAMGWTPPGEPERDSEGAP